MENNFQRQRGLKMPLRISEKWSATVLEEGFVPFPKKLVRCIPRLFGDPDGTKDLAAVLAIVDFKRPNLPRLPSKAFLAFLAGLEEREFDAALHRLEKKGYVRASGDADGLDVALDGLLNAIEMEAK